MFAGPEINKIVAATLAASAAPSSGANQDRVHLAANYLKVYKELLLGLDKLDDEIAQERSTANMKRLNQRRATGEVA